MLGGARRLVLTMPSAVRREGTTTIAAVARAGVGRAGLSPPAAGGGRRCVAAATASVGRGSRSRRRRRQLLARLFRAEVVVVEAATATGRVRAGRRQAQTGGKGGDVGGEGGVGRGRRLFGFGGAAVGGGRGGGGRCGGRRLFAGHGVWAEMHAHVQAQAHARSEQAEIERISRWC